MTRIKCFSVFTLIIISILTLNNTAFSEITKDKKAEAGISVGAWFGGDVKFKSDDYGEVKLSKKINFMMKAYADAYIFPAFAMGIYANYIPDIRYKSSEEGQPVSDKQTVFELGLSVKPRFLINDYIAIKPGLGIGCRKIYRRFTTQDDPGQDFNALGLNVSAELQFAVSKSMIVYLEPGFLSQPVGKNDDLKMTFPPIVYLLAGVAF